MPSQRPYFLSSFIAAFRQQGPTLQTNQQPNKHTSQTTNGSSPSPSPYPQTASAPRSISSTAAASSAQANSRSPPTSVSIHSPRGSGATSIPIPNPSASGRRRGSDSSSEGFRDAIGADRWYIGGRTAGGEEKFFKLGVVRRVKSNDGLSLDRLSL
ncbi:hypothetical protein VFPPC_13734 [Pochonia chlamydosporia 170]|uniref:Uncharacterized protein n=1 Tax=Pochonia chlamydosporia 170 TaxID=1380566 RepID=A0A179FT82_METCM|nr:hypothetical protein VFPPC_13734 [Pochonia chlamydosporia 170]OAQ68794.1 hypothetical protein VFPPC_13734 [Pochonia chlamydosporia 170]